MRVACRDGADGGLPAENFNRAYTTSGALLAYGSKIGSYLNTATYTPEGQPATTDFGTLGKKLDQYETYDPGTNRLLQTIDNLQTTTSGTTTTSALDTTSYTYTESGQVTSVTDAQGGGASDVQCFTYDSQNRLTTAWTTTGGTTTTNTDSSSAPVSGIGGCTDSTPTASTIGGASPYWQSYTYDALGDRTSQTIHDTTGNTANNITQTLTYPGGGTTPATQPDAVATVATTSAGGTATTTYGYDNQGDTTTRTTTTTGSTPPVGPGQTIAYDAEGRTQSVKDTATNTTTSYLHDADGNLLIQKDTGSTVLYLPFNEQLTLNTNTNTVSALRYYTDSPDGVVEVRSSSGTLTFEIANTQGTAAALVDAATSAVTRRYYDPYGNSRGTTPTSWVDNRGFLDQPVDTATGLDLLGARQYDATTGRFLSVDPILETGDARQMNGYAYAADDPTNGADPSGLNFPGQPTGGGTTSTPPSTCQGPPVICNGGYSNPGDPCGSGSLGPAGPGECTEPNGQVNDAPPIYRWILKQQSDQAAQAASIPHCSGFWGCLGGDLSSIGNWAYSGVQAGGQILADAAPMIAHGGEMLLGAGGMVLGASGFVAGFGLDATGVLSPAGLVLSASSLALATTSGYAAVQGAQGLGNDMNTMLNQANDGSGGGGGSGDGDVPRDLKQLGDKQLKKILKQYNTDPHEFKEWFVGDRAISKFDVKAGGNGLLYLVSKGGKVVIPTDYSVAGE